MDWKLFSFLAFIIKKRVSCWEVYLLQKKFNKNLFLPHNEYARLENKKKRHLMQVMDAVNHKFGYSILQFAATGIERPWKMSQEARSPCFTTCWEDLLTIKI